MTGDGVARVRQALEDHGWQPRGSSQRTRARCLLHGSHEPTLAVSQGRNGALISCHAGCDTADVLAELGLTWTDLFDEPRDQPLSPVIRHRDGDQFAELRRVVTRAVNIMILRDQLAAEPSATPVPADERVRLAEELGQQDAEDHYHRTLARLAALACNETYVRQAYTDAAAHRACHEQHVVLAYRREDLDAAREESHV